MALLGIVPGHGGFSLAQSSKSTPSWRYRWALDAAGLDHAPYQEHLDWLEMVVDPELYDRPWMHFTERHFNEYEAELHAKAAQAANARRDAARVASVGDVARYFPRTPVCLAPGGSCPYTGPCAQDGREIRDSFDARAPVHWATGDTAEPDKQALELGF